MRYDNNCVFSREQNARRECKQNASIHLHTYAMRVLFAMHIYKAVHGQKRWQFELVVLSVHKRSYSRIYQAEKGFLPLAWGGVCLGDEGFPALHDHHIDDLSHRLRHPVDWRWFRSHGKVSFFSNKISKVSKFREGNESNGPNQKQWQYKIFLSFLYLLLFPFFTQH